MATSRRFPDAQLVMSGGEGGEFGVIVALNWPPASDRLGWPPFADLILAELCADHATAGDWERAAEFARNHRVSLAPEIPVTAGGMDRRTTHDRLVSFR